MKTIGKLFKFLVVITWLAGWFLAALAVHVVRTPGKIAIVPKDRLNLHDTYVDIRTWTTAEAFNHPKLTARVFQAGKQDLFEHLGSPMDIAKLKMDIENAEIVPTKSVPDEIETRVDVR